MKLVTNSVTTKLLVAVSTAKFHDVNILAFFFLFWKSVKMVFKTPKANFVLTLFCRTFQLNHATVFRNSRINTVTKYVCRTRGHTHWFPCFPMFPDINSRNLSVFGLNLYLILRSSLRLKVKRVHKNKKPKQSSAILNVDIDLQISVLVESNTWYYLLTCNRTCTWYNHIRVYITLTMAYSMT